MDAPSNNITKSAERSSLSIENSTEGLRNTAVQKTLGMKVIAKASASRSATFMQRLGERNANAEQLSPTGLRRRPGNPQALKVGLVQWQRVLMPGRFALCAKVLDFVALLA